MFSYGLLIFLGLHLKYSVRVGEGTLRFSCGSSMFVYDGFEQWFHTLHPRCCSRYWWAMGNAVGKCLLLRDGGRRWEKLKTRGLENHATLAINVFVKPFKKSRWRVELEEFYL